MNTPKFRVITNKYISEWLQKNPKEVLKITSDAYLSFHEGNAINPDSYFLRYPSEPHNRIIALPASSEKKPLCSGIKWISSFPKNISMGLDRASAVFILNDRSTGYPLACLEGSQISSYRTAASAIVAANLIHPKGKYISNMVIIGCGLIASTTLSLMVQTGWIIEKITLVDLSRERADLFVKRHGGLNFKISKEIVEGDLFLFATSAIEPYILKPSFFKNNPTILHMSLRDLGIEIIKKSQNFVDDINHALKANTSLHLAEQKLQSRRFVEGNIAQLIKGEIGISEDKPRVYSPFGMGIIDLFVSYRIYETTLAEHIEGVHEIDGFFPKPYIETVEEKENEKE